MRENFYSENTVKGRKAYPCKFCPEPIVMGALHVSVTNCDGGQFYSHRAHVQCHALVTGQQAPAPRSAAQEVAA